VGETFEINVENSVVNLLIITVVTGKPMKIEMDGDRSNRTSAAEDRPRG
jgi:hypothetical protein